VFVCFKFLRAHELLAITDELFVLGNGRPMQSCVGFLKFSRLSFDEVRVHRTALHIHEAFF